MHWALDGPQGPRGPAGDATTVYRGLDLGSSVGLDAREIYKQSFPSKKIRKKVYKKLGVQAQKQKEVGDSVPSSGYNRVLKKQVWLDCPASHPWMFSSAHKALKDPSSQFPFTPLTFVGAQQGPFLLGGRAGAPDSPDVHLDLAARQPRPPGGSRPRRFASR